MILNCYLSIRFILQITKTLFSCPIIAKTLISSLYLLPGYFIRVRAQRYYLFFKTKNCYIFVDEKVIY